MPLAYLAWAAAGLAQTGYSYYELIPWTYRLGPTFDYPLFEPAFTSGSYFSGVAVGRTGTLYVNADYGVQRITPQGDMIPVTGYGSATVQSGERTWALLTAPAVSDMAEDSHGNLFIGGYYGLYRITPDRLIELYASLSVTSLAIDPADHLYALVKGTQVVRVAPDGTITPIAGTGEAGFSGDGGAATAARLNVAYGIALDPEGDLWIADTNNNRIRKVDRNGTITTAAEVPSPYRLAADSRGNVYFVQWSSSIVKRLSPDGAIDTVAQAAGFAGGLAVDAAGNLYLAGSTGLRMLDAAGVLHTVAGCVCGGDGGSAVWGRVASTAGLARDAAGNTYFSDPASSMVRRVAPDGTLATVAGNGDPGFGGDGGPAREARLSYPTGLAMDSAGNLYIADEQNNRIRKVSPDGMIQTVAGNGEGKFAGDGGPAPAASLGLPDGVAVDAAGNLYIADTASHRIRKVTPDGIMHTIAGSDPIGADGDGGPAALAHFINPRALAIDPAGNLLITDSSARVVRRITPAGIIERVAGTGQQGQGGDGGPAVDAQMDLPWGIAVDSAGNIYIGDGYSIREVDRSGTILTIGYGTAKGLAVESNGNLWLATGNTVALATRGAPPFPLPPVIRPQRIANAAISDLYPLSNYPSAAVAPGEIVTIPGSRLGSDPAGTRVLFDGVAAPVLAVRPDQVTAIAPFSIAGRATLGVTVEVNGVRSNREIVAVLPSVPELFRSYANVAAAINQDGTRNGPGNPARSGSVVALFGTGGGEVVALPVAVTMGGQPAEITYAGPAPGFEGGFQVNVRVPAGVDPNGSTVLWVGDAKASAIYVWVAP